MRYVIDIDGTICTNTDGDYEKAIPYKDRIQKINKLYDDGNIIIYFTARGMNTFNGDVIKSKEKWYDFTKLQLINWDVKFNELILGKPQGDLYIDDKGINDNDFFK